MLIFPAIDIINGEAVRLYKGDYDKKTVFSQDPLSIAKKFYDCGAKWVHLVDLDGAKSGDTPNFETVCKIKKESGLLCEIGGGIRTLKTVDAYINAGLDRVILGTAAVKDEEFLKRSIDKYGDKIAVGIDIKDGAVAIKGWTELSEYSLWDFLEKMTKIGVSTVICTDISKDGAMSGTNREMYREISKNYDMNITASGGVSTLDDIAALKKMSLYGAIVGKAYYTGDIDLKRAIEVAK
ncbi:MAG: 1-(5-phosphoribosyl)-5-[(5-phosphoribosylamino)methylideneamino]imidazole-4-carboxamide isomerase [Clostridia bacterium]|nr:1-(5-phosphoribosyl)-5-[(5-phosphoribosylamino)methylideneamino]imidazole-4-carboxamide isomerase [Clostridia bacterium]